MIAYAEFLSRKAIIDYPTGIESPLGINNRLYEFQRACVKWALIRGRAALFEGAGLGKTPQQCEYARIVELHTKLPFLIVAPLAVSHQTIAEAKKLLNMTVIPAESQENVAARGVYITNYQKLAKFDLTKFGGIALDESSILKSQDGASKQKLIEECETIPFRLACTATPAPNDYMELGNHAEWLGVMTASEMLSAFFVHDGGETQKWRLKRHAEEDFWRWMASWAICITHPRDLGFEQEGYDLPPLRMHEIIVETDQKPLPGELFPFEARTLTERREARKVTINERVEKCREMAAKDDSQFLAWCNLNAESEAIAEAIGAVQITGADTDEHKEKTMIGFAFGKVPKIATKPSIAGFGMNWQSCHRMAFVGLSDSFEQLFQAIRRCWRFGQANPVDVYIIISALEGAVLKNIKRKEADAEAMQRALVCHMANFTKSQLTAKASRHSLPYKPCKTLTLPSFLRPSDKQSGNTSPPIMEIAAS